MFTEINRRDAYARPFASCLQSERCMLNNLECLCSVTRKRYATALHISFKLWLLTLSLVACPETQLTFFVVTG